MQNSVISIRNTRLYGSQPSCLVFGCKAAPFGPDLQVPMGPRPHLSFWACKTVICTRISNLYGFQPSSVALCLQNSGFKTRLTSLYGSQNSSVVLSTQNSELSTGIKRLYGFQPSPVVLCLQSSGFSTWNTSLYWSQPSSEFFACKPATIGPKLHVSMGPRRHLWFSAF